jgi:ADP-heptose:LPS heptosyltransferase
VGEGAQDVGTHHTESQFVAIVDQCDAVITGDTLGMHVALSRGVPVIALFVPTCEQEIDVFGLGSKIISPCDCGPCYRRVCDKKPNCMDLITPEQVAASIGAAPPRRQAEEGGPA